MPKSLSEYAGGYTTASADLIDVPDVVRLLYDTQPKERADMRARQFIRSDGLDAVRESLRTSPLSIPDAGEQRQASYVDGHDDVVEFALLLVRDLMALADRTPDALEFHWDQLYAWLEEQQ